MSAAHRFRRGSKRSKMRRSLTLAERINVIKKHHRIPNIRELSNLFRCSVTQIKNILRRKGEYLEEFANDGNLARIKRRQSARFLTIGVVICEWLYRITRKGQDVSDEAILAMAKKVTGHLNMSEIRTNNNWLERMRMKFKISEPELEEIAMFSSTFDESLEIDDIIQDLRNSCPHPEMLSSSLAFPFELTRRYLKETMGVDDDYDISKVRMKNCLEEARDDKFLTVDGNSQQIKEEAGNVDDYCNKQDDFVDIKSEIKEASSDSYNSAFTEHTGLQFNETQEVKTVLPAICIKQEALTKGIRSYKEAYNILGPMEQFALAREDVRAVGLINQLENHYTDMMLAGEK